MKPRQDGFAYTGNQLLAVVREAGGDALTSPHVTPLEPHQPVTLPRLDGSPVGFSRFPQLALLVQPPWSPL